MITLPVLCRDLFLLAHIEIDDRGPGRGRQWEQQVADYLAMRNAPVEVLPGGYTVFGHVSLSTLRHQIDGAIGCADSIVVAEWKAFRGGMPKNELLRFKAATDDYFMAMGHDTPHRPDSQSLRWHRIRLRRDSSLCLPAWYCVDRTREMAHSGTRIGQPCQAAPLRRGTRCRRSKTSGMDIPSRPERACCPE